jgi:hypothetical protein
MYRKKLLPEFEFDAIGTEIQIIKSITARRLFDYEPTPRLKSEDFSLRPIDYRKLRSSHEAQHVRFL